MVTSTRIKNQSGVQLFISMDKVARLNAVTPMIEGGRFPPQEARWLDDFMEIAQCSQWQHDDQTDALSLGLDC